MASINITDLNNAKLDVDHIAEVATSTADTATDRLGHVKKTLSGAVATIAATNNRGAWVTGTAYAIKDLVSNSGTWYICVSAHTAGATFSIDSSSKWRVYQGVIADDLAASSGASLVGFQQSLSGAVARTVAGLFEERICTFDFMTAAQIADVKAGTFMIDCTAAVQAAVNAAIASGIKRVHAPGKGYLINGVASADTMKNGVLFPFSQVNFDPKDQIIFEGDSAGTVFRCGSTSMIMFRVSRNCTILRNVTIDGNSLANTWGVGIVPESITQTTTLVSQSFCELDNVSRVNLTEGIVFQPGPHSGAFGSGCYYHKITGGISNNNTRHVYAKKSTTYSTLANYITRTQFIGQRLVRGNSGYYFDAGTEIDLIGCNEEMINSGTSPLATPTARYVASNCASINFFGGFSEACSKSVDMFANNVRSWGYTPASGPNLAFRTYAQAWADNTDDSSTWTPVVVSSGGGTQGASTSTGYCNKQGKVVFFSAQISVAKGTLAAGTLSISGLPFAADSAWAGASSQMVPVPYWSGITFTAGVTSLVGLVSGGNIIIRKVFSSGAGTTGLTLAECSDPIIFTVQGSYKAA